MSVTPTWWQCTRCGASGQLPIVDERGAWAGIHEVLDAHHATAPTCPGGVQTVQVSLTPPPTPTVRHLRAYTPKGPALRDGRVEAECALRVQGSAVAARISDANCPACLTLVQKALRHAAEPIV